MTDTPREAVPDPGEVSPEGGDSPDLQEPAEPDLARERRFPDYVYNPISLTGAALAAAMLIAILFVFVIDITSEEPSPYMGILGFAILPIPLLIGLLMIPAGMWLEWKREKKIEVWIL